MYVKEETEGVLEWDFYTVHESIALLASADSKPIESK
jgi:hypothetical protein